MAAVVPIRKPTKAEIESAARAAALVDELGDIEAKLAPYRRAIAREEQARKELRQLVDGAPPANPIAIEGARYVCDLGPRANQSVINYKALVKAIGARAFAGFATCTLGALEEHAPELVGAVVSKVATGARHISISPRETAAT